MRDLISRQSAYATVLAMYVRCDTGDIEDYRDMMCESILVLPSAPPDDMIHLQKEQAYLKGWEEGREALRKEMWEDEQDRLD